MSCTAARQLSCGGILSHHFVENLLPNVSSSGKRIVKIGYYSSFEVTKLGDFSFHHASICLNWFAKVFKSSKMVLLARRDHFVHILIDSVSHYKQASK